MTPGKTRDSIESLTSSERLFKTLAHKEPDRIPFDLGGTSVTGISLKAYKNLIEYLGIQEDNIRISNTLSQVVKPGEEVLTRLKIDTIGLFPKPAEPMKVQNIGNKFIDEWGIEFTRPGGRDSHFCITGNPLKDAKTIDDIRRYNWPDPSSPKRFEELKSDFTNGRNKKKAIIVDHFIGAFSHSIKLRGMIPFFMDLAINPKMTCYLMDNIIEMEKVFWAALFDILEEQVRIVRYSCDLGTQESLMISPQLYRKYIKPRQKKLFEFIKSRSKREIYIFFHSDGAVYDLIPDFIEIGIDILNPVQINVKNMQPDRLKKEFGKDITFWGAGIDSQKTLPFGSPKEIKDAVRRLIDIMAPGGGFVFSCVHNIQPEVPPENIMAMWATLNEHCKY